MIRQDAISAVGAPSTVQYLIKAIYWLYLVVNTYFIEVVKEVSVLEKSMFERVVEKGRG